MAQTRHPSEILRAARQALDFAKQGAHDYSAGGDRRVSGLFNAITSGRSVTFVLQNLRGRAEGFEDWYTPITAELAVSAVAKWAKNLRNDIEKRGDTGALMTTLHIKYLDSRMIQQSAPSGTTQTVLGDEWGRNYWVVRLADGTDEKIYFALAPEVGVASVVLNSAPNGRAVDDLLAEYISMLEAIVSSAEQQFG
ncbi:MAG: hypothetical protein QOH56_2788 [Pseudonocardiales bacterium]|nr:hypothetical protein [Pseudonocardiales bacterium]